MLIDKPFMKLPVRHSVDEIDFAFFESGKFVFNLKAKYDPEAPDFTYFAELPPYLVGKELEIRTSKAVDVLPELCEKRPRYVHESEKYRPKLHFTAPAGWLNDPNGLCTYNGEHHLFYQYAPHGINHSICSWGHAVTQNFIDYEHRDIAIFPDETGATISGSGIVDENNVLGLNTPEHKAIVLFFTAAGRKCEQYIAVSTDGGKSFQKKKDAPVIPHIVGDNRDPKVIYHKESGNYVMVLFLHGNPTDGGNFGIFVSRDLLNWRRTQTLFIPREQECPNMFPLKAPDGSEKWVFHGVFDRYCIGSFDGEIFTAETDFDDLHYAWLSKDKSVVNAAQSWTNLKDGRNVRVVWAKTRLEKPECFIHLMTVAHELTLREIGGKLKLCANPVREIEGLHIRAKSGMGSNLKLPLDCVTNDIVLRFDQSAEGISEVTAHGAKIIIDFDAGKLLWTWKEGTPDAYTSEAPITAIGGFYEFRIITDTTCAEIFASGGSVNMCIIGQFADCVPELAISGDVMCEYTVHTLRSAIITDGRTGTFGIDKKSAVEKSPESEK